MPLIKDVVFHYVKIKNPALEYGGKPDKENPLMNKEYVVDVVIPAKTFKKFRKSFKGVAAVKNAKEITAAEYQETYRVAPPEGDKYVSEDGDYAVMKFRKKAYYKDSGDATKKPRVAGVKRTISNGEVVATKDKNGKLVSEEVEIGNGTVGNLLFTEREWEYEGKSGLSLDLAGIQISDLVEYSTPDVDEFEYDDEESDEEDFDNAESFDDDDDVPAGDTSSDDDDDGEW